MTRSSPKTRELSLGLGLLVTTSLSLSLVVVMFLITFGVALAVVAQQLSRFSVAAHTTPVALISQAVASWSQTPIQNQGRKNILVLGTDELANRGNAVPLTDTIMLASINLETGNILTLSLPRDLWSDTYQARLNALFAFGKQRNPSLPLALIETEVESLTQLPIHHTVVVSLETVAELVDLVGGVEVEVTESFTDDRFPRSDVDVTVETDPKKLYKTVVFTAGKQRLSGERALEYIRSRKSLGSQGNDQARSQRQQQVIAALLMSINQPSVIKNPSALGQLYAFYLEHFSPYLPMTEALATAKSLLPVAEELHLHGSTLSVYPDNPQGVLYHPPENTTGGAWVYRIRSLDQFHQEVATILQLTSLTAAEK